ncbi:YadA-like family protein [Gallibacterium anatis]|uniref:YadA-like family protein n=1 Tax=Gallibacterium anatis TaxID=750 RepID=UPI0039FC4A26
MNKIYKVIFNRNKNRYEIVSELASSRGGKCKVKAGKQIAKLFMTGLLATFLSSVALAADEEVKVKYDAATGTIKIVKVSDGSEVASYAVGGNISPITSIGTEKGAEKDTKNPTGIIAMGDQSKAVQSNSIAIGANAHAGDNLTPAKGKDYPEDNSTGYIAIGTKAVASGERSISLGNESSTNKGSYNIVQGNDSIGIGTSTSVFGYSGVSIGRRNIIGVPDPDLVKEGVLTTKARTKYSENDLGGNSVIVGAYNVAYGNRSSIIGTYSRAMGSNSVAIGSGVQSLSDGSIAIGKGSGYEFEDGSRFKNGEDVTGDYYGRDWELPPEYKVLKQVLSNDINGDKPYKKSSSTRKGYRYEKGGSLPKYNNYGAGSSDPGGFIVEGENALGIGTYTQVRGNSAIGLATGEMTADLSEMDKSQYARDMRKIMDMEETLYDAKEALKSDSTSDKATLEANVKTAEESLAAAKKEFRKNYLSKYSFVEGEGALGVGRQILAQGDRSMAVGDYAKAISNDAIAYGGQTLANGTNSMAMGGSAHVGTTDKSFDNSMAIGSHTNVQAGNAVALGAFSQVTGQNSLALGFGKQSGDAITYNSVSGKDSTLIGSYGTVKGNNSILIGSNGNIANDRVVGLGNNINIEAADQNDQENNTAGSVFLGDHAGYVKDSKRSRSLGQVDVVGSAGKMELTESLSSTKGALRDYTKDFIYIYMLERQDDGTQIGAPIAVRSDFAGGDSTVGVVSVGSTYEQQFNSLQDIKDYHTKMGSLITVPVDVTVQVTKNGVSLGEQQQTRYFAADSTREEIYADSTLKEADKEKVWNAIQSKTSTPNTTYTVFETRRIQNVAPGLIGLNSTDAINGSQLFATNQMLGNLVGSLKKTFGDNVTITEDGQIKVSGEGTLGWIAKANTVDGSNGKVTYDVDKETDETEEAYQARKAKLQKDGYIVDAAKVMTFKAGKNIGLVQKPGEFSISTIDTPSFKSVELRGDEKTVDGKKVTEVTKIDSSGMKVVTETSTPASDGSTTPTVTEKVSTTVGKDGVSTDGSVKVTNGTTDLVTIDKGTDDTGTDQEYGKIGLDGKNGSNATITVDRGTSSLDDTKNIGGTDPKQDISENNPAKMDRITYTTKDKDNNDVTHEVATMDDGLFFSGDSADGENNNVKNKFDRKLSQETKIIGGVDLGLTDSASAKERQEAIAAKLTDGNIGVISDGTDTLTVKLAKQLTGLDSTTYTSPTTKTGDGDATSTMKVDGNGIRFVDDKDTVKTDAPSLTTDGIDGGNKQITNIGSGFKNGTTSVTIDDIKNPGDTLKNSNVWNNAVNVGDLKNIIDTGFKLNTSGQPTKPDASTVKIGDTINIIDGANTKVSAIDDSTTGTHTFHIDVTGMPISYTDGEGNALTKIGDKYYKNTDIENGKPKTDATEVPADKVTNNIKVINKDGTTNNQGTISNVKSVFDSNIGNGADTGSKVDEIKDGSVIPNTGSNQFINDLTKLNDQVDPKATDAEVEKIRAKKDEEKLNSVSTVRDLQKVALTPLFFEGDVAQDEKTANTFDRKLSEKTKIVGGQKDVTQLTDGNIGVVSNGTDTLTIKLAKNLVNLTSVETGSGNNKTKMTENGVTTTVKDGDTFKVTTTTPNGLATTEVKLDSDDKPTGESTTTMVTTDGVTITTQTPPDPDGDKPASTTETKLSKDGLATDGTIKVTGDNAKDLVTIGKGTETDPNATDKEFGTVVIDGKNDSKATLTVDRGTKSVTDSANVGKDPTKPIDKDNPVAGMDRLTYTTTGIGDNTIEHQVATLDDGFFLTTEHTEEDKTRTVLFNNTIKVLDGANTKVSAMGGEKGTHTFSIDVTGLPVSYTVQQDGNTTPENVSKVGDTYQLANGTKLVKVGNKFYKPDQLVNPTVENPTVKQGEENKDWKLTNNVSLVNPNGGKDAPTLSNVGSALKKSDGTRITMSDLDDGNEYPTDNPIWNNAVNVGDLKAATDAARTEVTGTGEAFVTSKQATDGHTIYNVHVDKILSHKDAAGNELVRGGDGKYYTNEEIKDKTYIPSENKWYSNRDITDGKPNEDAQAVTPNPVDQSNVKTSLVNPNTGVGTGTDTSMTLDNVKSGIGGDAGNGIKGGTTVDGTQGNNTFIKNLDKVGSTGKGAIDKTTVVNAGDLKNLADTPLFFSGDVADSKDGNVKNTFGRKLSEEAKIVGGVTTPANLTDNNIGVVSNGSDTLTIKLAKQLTGLDSATYTSPTTKTDDGDATSTMKVDGNGIRFVGDNNAVKTDAPSLTTDGITGGNKQITNVGSGLKDGDTTISISDLKDPNKVPPTSPVLNNAINVGDLKNIIDTGFKLNTSGQATKPGATTVKIGDTINIIDGANTKVSAIDDTVKGTHTFHIDVTGLPMTYTVSQTGGTDAPVSVSKVGDTYQLADGTKLVKVGDKFYKPSQLVDPNADQPQVKPEEENKDWTVNDSISLVNKDGSNNAPTTLKNVGSGLKDANGNSTTLDQAVGSNAVNVDDLRTLGKAATTEVTGTGAAEVTKVTGADGQNIYNVHVERFMQVAETDVEGNKVVKAADNYYYKEADIKDKTYIDGQWYNNTDIEDKTKIGDKWYSNTEITDGKANPGATELTVKATTPNKAVGLQNNLVNPNDNTPTRLSNLASALSGEVGNGANPADNSAINGIDKNGKPTSESGNNTFVKNVLDLDATEKTVEQLKTSLGHEPSEDEVKAEKARAEKDKALLNSAVTVADLQKTLQSPLFFEGDSADGVANENDSDKNTFARKLSQKTKIVGGVDLGLKENATAEDRKKAIADKLTDGNIGVISDGSNTLTVKLAKNLVNLTSVETGSGDNKTKMTKNGITTTVKDGDTFKVTTTTPNGLATTEVKLDSDDRPTGESTTTMVTTDGVTITTQTPKNGDKPASTTETKLSKDGLATDGTIKVTGDNAKDLVTIGKGTETDQNATDKEFGTVTIDGKNGSNATLTVDRGTSSLDDTKNIGTDPNQDISENNPAKMDRITYTTKNKDGKDVTHEVATLDDGFFLTTSTDVAKGKAAAGVKLNHTIKFTDGANTKVSTVDSKDGIHELHVDVTGLPMTYTVSQTGGTDAPVSVSKVGDTYQLADGTKLVKVGDKFYKPSQLVNPKADQPEVKPDEVAKDWSVNDSVSLVNKDGSTNAPTLKNVGSGLKDANGNSTTLDQAVGSNAVNVDDLRTMGKAATTEVTGTGAAEVTKVTGANGQNIYNVHVERFMQVAETDVEGNKVVKAADNHYYKEADIKDKTYIDGQWYNNTDIKDKTKIGDKWYNADDVVNGVPEPNATELTVQATTAPNKAVGLQNNLVNPNDNKPTRLSNLASALSGEVGNGANPADNSAINGIDKNGKPTSESGSNTFVKNVLDLDATEKTVEQLKTSLGHEPSEDEVKAEKARAEKDKALLNSAVTVADLQKTLQSPLFFEGDSADGVANENGSDKNTFARKLSQKTKIVGGVDLGLKENATAEERKKAIAEKLTDHNIGVISNGTDTLTIKLAKDLTDLHSVTTTDDKGNTTQINGKGLATTTDDGKGNIKITTVTSDGITIVTTDKDGNNSVSLTNKGLDNGHHQIINVKSGLLDRQGKPVTLKEASGDILNNAVNVKDLRDIVQGLTDSGKGGGFGLTGNNGEVSKSLGETITLKGGIANKVENGRDMNKPEKATTDKNTYIDVKTSKNGSEKIMVVEIAKDLTDLNSAEFTDQEGNTTKMKGDGIYIDKNGDGNADISLTSEGLNNGGNKITNVADGTEDTDAVNVSQLNKLKQEIKQNIGDEINELNAYAPVVYTDENGKRVSKQGDKFVNEDGIEVKPHKIKLSLVNADGKTTNPSTLQNVAKGVNKTDAVNVEQLKEATEKPLTFNGDAGSSSAKLGETVAIKGGANSADLTDNNIGVIADSSTKTLNVKLSKKLKGLESAEFVDNNGNTTNITGDGVHISGGNGSNVSLTSQGLNNGGNRITNVAPGVEATDAVNVSQLNQVGAALHNRINNVAKGAYGGVASAGAMASLPQAYLPGKSMVAAGASHYRGESAVALGASRISDNGKIILKLNASHNTSGNTMVGAGVGYQF